MYSQGHLIFIGISLILIIFGVQMCRKYRPPIDKLVQICFLLSLFLEAAKILTVIEIIPVVEPVVENGVLVYRGTGAYAPYIQREHLPFELCSLQIVFMFLELIVSNPVWKKRLLAFMYGTTIVGGMMALLFSSIAPEFETTAAFLTAPRAWEFYLYHAMIIVLGIAIGMDKDVNLRFSDCRWMMVILVALDCCMFYLNSIMSIPYYQGDTLVGMGYAINYFSSYDNFFGIVMDTKMKWICWLLFRIGLGALLIALVYLPFLGRKEDTPKTEGNA